MGSGRIVWLVHSGRGCRTATQLLHMYTCMCTCTCLVHTGQSLTSSDGTDGVILRIVKAGCHPVAIAQVVEHWQLKSEALGSIPGGCWFFMVL